MTMQVGMMASDGVLIAGDKVWANNESTQYASARHTSNTTKIEINYDKGVAIACARSMELATRVAQDLLSELDPGDWAGPENRIKPITTKLLEQLPEKRRHFQCIIATARPEFQLFHLYAGLYDLQKGVECRRQDHTVFAGDTMNSAVFWRERYYSSWEGSPLPIDQLIPLAAHIVLSAGQIGRGAIGGLEIVRCDKDGVRHLSKQSIEKLKIASVDWDARFGKEILTHRQNFTYAPDMIG